MRNNEVDLTPEFLENMADAAFEAAMDLESHECGHDTPPSVTSFLKSLNAVPNCDKYTCDAVPAAIYDERGGVERVTVLVLDAARNDNLVPAAAAAILAVHDAFLLASHGRQTNGR